MQKLVVAGGLAQDQSSVMRVAEAAGEAMGVDRVRGFTLLEANIFNPDFVWQCLQATHGLGISTGNYALARVRFERYIGICPPLPRQLYELGNAAIATVVDLSLDVASRQAEFMNTAAQGGYAMLEMARGSFFNAAWMLGVSGFDSRENFSTRVGRGERVQAILFERDRLFPWQENDIPDGVEALWHPGTHPHIALEPEVVVSLLSEEVARPDMSLAA